MSHQPESIGAVSFIANISLAAVKIIVGSAGASYALIADGIESLADCVSSLVVWNGLRVASKKADHDHPYGHGKAEALAAFLAGVGLVISAFIIVWQAIGEYSVRITYGEHCRLYVEVITFYLKSIGCIDSILGNWQKVTCSSR